jgi:hypothetical protein
MDYSDVVSQLRAHRDEVTRAIISLERIAGIRKKRGRPFGPSTLNGQLKNSRATATKEDQTKLRSIGGDHAAAQG